MFTKAKIKNTAIPAVLRPAGIAVTTPSNRWGWKTPANRLPLAIERTVPMAMFLYSLTTLWYAQHGHAHVQFPQRPWYRRKNQPSFVDMLTTLRRVTWKETISPVRPRSTVWKKTVNLLTYLATLAG